MADLSNRLAGGGAAALTTLGVLAQRRPGAICPLRAPPKRPGIRQLRSADDSPPWQEFVLLPAARKSLRDGLLKRERIFAYGQPCDSIRVRLTPRLVLP
jgi:hypothetical protein